MEKQLFVVLVGGRAVAKPMPFADCKALAQAVAKKDNCTVKVQRCVSAAEVGVRA